MTLVDEVRAIRGLPSPQLARMIRVSAGVSQKRLGAEIGVDRTTIIRWEAGQSKPRGEQRVRYAEVLAALQKELAA